jgi:hypothetical protein
LDFWGIRALTLQKRNSPQIFADFVTQIITDFKKPSLENPSKSPFGKGDFYGYIRSKSWIEEQNSTFRY